MNNNIINNRAVENAVRAFKDSLITLIDSRNYAITQELYTEMKAILNACDSVKLDNMFLAKSETWRSQFNAADLAQKQQEIFKLLSDGAVMIHDLKVDLSRSKMSSLQENQIRKIHYVAKERLRGFIKAIHPYTREAYTRLDNYTVNLGLRDRFTTIRNELSPAVYQQDTLAKYVSWADKTRPDPVPATQTPDWREATYGLKHDDGTRKYESRASSTNKNLAGWYFVNSARTNFSTPQQNNPETQVNKNNSREQESETNENNYDNTLNTGNGAKNLERSKTSIETRIIPFNTKNNNNTEDWKKHATEAGINLNFPGISEQKYRYTKPVKPEYKNFVLNPQPDYSRFDRPFTIAACYPISTEYSSRYQYPDANKIDKFPWIKQF